MTVTLLTATDAAPALATLHDTPADRNPALVYLAGLGSPAYRSRWREITGAPPGPRQWFVYAGRDAGGRWWILGQGTGP